MEVFCKVIIRSPSDGYSYTFAVPFGLTRPTAHTIAQKTLDSLTRSVDKATIRMGSRVYLMFTMKNPALNGISLPCIEEIPPPATVTIKCDIAEHSGIPIYQLYNKTWVVDAIDISASEIDPCITL